MTAIEQYNELIATWNDKLARATNAIDKRRFVSEVAFNEERVADKR